MRLSIGWLLIAAALLGSGIAVLIVAIVLTRPAETAWVDQPHTIEDVDPLMLWIRPSDGSSQRQMTRGELHSKFPPTIVLPSRMPEDYELAAVDLVESGHRLLNPDSPTTLSVHYGGDLAALTFSQRAGDSFNEVESSNEVRVAEVRGLHYTWTEPISSEWLVWARCGRVFSIWSTPEHKLSTADLVRIAESVGPEAC